VDLRVERETERSGCPRTPERRLAARNESQAAAQTETTQNARLESFVQGLARIAALPSQAIWSAAMRSMPAAPPLALDIDTKGLPG